MCYNSRMKTPRQITLEHLRNNPTTRLSARQATWRLGGRWIMFGELPCPICAEEDAVQISDHESGATQFANRCGCDGGAVGDAVTRWLSAEGVDAFLVEED